MGHHNHDRVEPTVAICTISSSRSHSEDSSGDVIESILCEADISIGTRELLDDSVPAIRSTVESLANDPDIDGIVTTGGTGVTPDDCTIEALDQLFEKRLPGFGELFRQRSIEEIGSRVVATRATAGIIDATVVCCLPGSENAARLGAAEIIAPELGHLAGLAQRS
ncbi:MogA/MoaB family molybdenum cofactor biosynthesis protein [Halocatena halophila]|uniref:MogA/MoaB family molybdenum cofactor biosynthesis protein n=1 Tax=Halocatena halophila TaxID=2814576 RepID=UPI002ED4243B